jgi:gamma-glutamylcyclotransferase (GGCT)/AIG2-like uncharacterized protein YtfP
MFYYFAYGSNTNIRQMAQRCPEAYPVMNAVLEGYRLEFRGNLRFKGVANVKREKGARVEGVLWNVTKACLNALDGYEGHPIVYTRQEVKVNVSVTDRKIKAITYIMLPPFYRRQTIPSEDYLNRIIEGYEKHSIPLDVLATAVRAARSVQVSEVKKMRTLF